MLAYRLWRYETWRHRHHLEQLEESLQERNRTTSVEHGALMLQLGRA